MPDTNTTTTAAEPSPVGLPDFGSSGGTGAPRAIGLLSDVTLQVRIELGRTKMLVEDVLKLNADSVVELDKAAGDPVDIYVNGRRVARGEVLVLNENFCVRVSEIIEPVEG
jgi:flagellar motor switch protein FliN/FliY